MKVRVHLSRGESTRIRPATVVRAVDLRKVSLCVPGHTVTTLFLLGLIFASQLDFITTI